MNICDDNRFEIIEKAKEALLDSTNIEQSPDEMKVLDNFLFRCWQMGWLDKYEKKNDSWIPCSERLPEEGAVVLVSLEEDEDWSWVRLVREGYYDEGYWFDMDGAHYGLEILAWKPLPPAYKEGE